MDKIPEFYPTLQDKQGERLMAGYLASLEFDLCLGEPRASLVRRQEWNQNGYRYTTFLINEWSRKEQRFRTAVLLGGTRDDRAALALVRFLRVESEPLVRLAIYSALAELGFYTEYHARLLLSEHEKCWPLSPNYVKDTQIRPERSVWLLAIIHHPEAVWAQDQLRKGHLVDGAVAEIEGPLLKFRDIALGRRPLPDSPTR